MSEPPTLLLGDCFEVLQTLEAESADACVCDPPYGLNFMGRHWDRGVPATDVWEQVYRVLKPLALMRYLVRMVTPPGGTVLDPFVGTGTTLLAARDLGFAAIGIELDPQALTIAKRRLGL